MNYEETIDFLYKQLPVYQRVGKAAYKADLNSTLQIATLLGHPERKFKSIHIAGTNGKGSTAHMLASVLQEAGFKTGLYTSPHLKDFRERIKINGEMIGKENVVEFVNDHHEILEEVKPSFFEWTVGLAFEYFADEEVDIAVLETGMGGRLDSTNIVTPEVSVITNIGLDHVQYLGDTLGKIAMEKAGIIKKNVPVIIGETHEDTAMVFNNKAHEMQSTIQFADQTIIEGEYETDLLGKYQESNLKTALLALKTLQQQGWQISEASIREGLRKVVENTGLLGRWQVLSQNPPVIADTAHNEDGITLVIQQLLALNAQALHIVWGMVNDKKIDAILNLLPKHATYYFCEPSIPRAMSVHELEKKAVEVGLTGASHSSVEAALNKAKENATSEDVIFVGGSTFVVAEVV